MFSLHERTERRVCRAAFLLCCAVPTLFTLGWIAQFHRPWHRSDLEQSLTEKLHVQTTVAHLSAPRPGERKLLGVELADLRTGKSLCSLNALIRKPFFGGQQFASPQLSLSAESLPDLARFAATWLATQERNPRKSAPLDLWVDQLEMVRNVGEKPLCFSLSNCRLRSAVTASGTQRLLLEAQLASAEETTEATTVRLIAERRSNGTVRAFLDTQSAKLPGWLLAELLPGASSWATADFAGKIEWEENEGEIAGTLQGTLSGIDLAEWLADAPYHLQAKATIDWEELTWQAQRIVIARGRLEAANGTISRQLLIKCAEELTCKVVETSLLPDESNEELVLFEQLAFRFRLNQKGLTLWGTCMESSSNYSGTLISATGKPLLMQPQVDDLPVWQVVHVLAPWAKGKSWVPATRQAFELASRLPHPEALAKKAEVASGVKYGTVAK